MTYPHTRSHIRPSPCPCSSPCPSLLQWRYVHIDDRIPCDRKGRPIYAHGKDVNETWVMLLEKAYAKLHGCYGTFTPQLAYPIVASLLA